MAGNYSQHHNTWVYTNDNSSPVSHGAVPMKKSDSGYASNPSESYPQTVDPSMLYPMDSQFPDYQNPNYNPEFDLQVFKSEFENGSGFDAAEMYADESGYISPTEEYPNRNMGPASFWPTEASPSQQHWEPLSPTEYPTERALENVKQWPCLTPGCKQKPFNRYADLDRHAKHVHGDDSKKVPYPCDWKRCNRRNDPFYRKDHYRDHLREYHREDLSKRGNSDPNWLDQCKINPDWWRCIRCLVRTEVATAGFDCANCGHKCESDRQNARMAMAHGAE